MLEISSAQSAAIQTAIHGSLGIPLGPPGTKAEMQLAAYAEIVAHPHWASEALSLGEVIDGEIRLSRKKDLTVDPSGLMEVHPKRMVRLSLMYAGVSPVQSGLKENWVVGQGGSDVLKLAATIIEG